MIESIILLYSRRFYTNDVCIFIEVLNIAATGYGLKFFLAASLTPLLYVLKSLLTEKYGLKPIPFNANEDDAVMEDFEKLKEY